VVYNTEFGGDNYIENGSVFPAHADNSNPYGSSDIIGVVVYDAWTDDNDREYDWAIIELDSNMGDNVGWLGLRYQGSSYNGTSI
jgi:V8-like Glu-specific endopeptidase